MQEPSDPDALLIQQLQAGQAGAFDELMGRYQRPVLNFVYRLLGDAAEAEDVAQEVFVRVHQRLGTYQPPARFSTWLFALARNAAIDHLRWRKRHPTDPLDEVSEPSAGRSVTEEVHGHEVGDQIAAAVAQLPEEQRTAVILSEYHGMSYAEIAAVLRSSEKSVETRLYRAKQTLRQRLRHLLD